MKIRAMTKMTIEISMESFYVFDEADDAGEKDVSDTEISAKFNTDQVEGIFSTRKRVPMTSATR